MGLYIEHLNIKLHEISNENVQRVVHFTFGKNMYINNTYLGRIVNSIYFPHKNIHKKTWISPDGKTQNQIDHVIIDIRHAKDITDVKTCTVADSNSHHVLVRARLRQRIATSKKVSMGKKEIGYNTGALKEEGKM
jgi:hypothetical protein